MENSIAIIGTHCTGKSTLLKRVSQEYPELNIVSSSTREIKKEFGLGINNTESDYNFTQLVCGNRDLEKMLLNKGSLYDRCFFDTMIYTIYLNQKKLVSNWVLDYQFNLFNLFLEKNSFTKFIFLRPTGIELVGDGDRIEDEKFRTDIDLLFAEYIPEFDFKERVVEINTPVKAIRFNKMVEILKDCKLV